VSFGMMPTIVDMTVRVRWAVDVQLLDHVGRQAVLEDGRHPSDGGAERGGSPFFPSGICRA